MNTVSTNESGDVLKGTTLEVYRFVLKSAKPVGVREVQRGAKLSSPSVATYHLSKLEEAYLLKRENGSYVVNRVLLENSIRVRHLLLPRYFFYLLFAIAALTYELLVIWPAVISREYYFTIVLTVIFIAIFSYETAKTALKKGI